MQHIGFLKVKCPLTKPILLIKIGTITIRTYLPMKNKFIYSHFSSCNLFLTSHHCGQKDSLNNFPLKFVENCFETFHVHLKKICILLILDGMSCVRECLTGGFLCAVSHKFSVPYQFLEWVVLHAALRTEIMRNSICLDSFQ